MKIGVFGGCFNPPHKMHKNIALNLLKEKYIDKAIFVPTGNFYNKFSLIDYKHRKKMLDLLFHNEKNIEISDIGSNAKCQYTYEVLDELKRKYPNDEICFICGDDNLEEMETWKNYKYLLENYDLIVINRNNKSQEIMKKYRPWKKRIHWAQIDSFPLSSTLIRKMIKEKNTENILDFLDKDIYNYIVREKLYINEGD